MRSTASFSFSAPLLMLAMAACLASQAHAKPHGQLEFELQSGSYQCEFGLKVDVVRQGQPAGNLQIAWQGKQYQLARDTSFSGLPRYEDSSNGLVWIDLPWKSVLLDGRTKKPLANECTTA